VRVLFAIGGLGAGGSEGQLVELITRIHPERAEAHLVTLSDGPPGPRLDRIREAGIPYWTVGPLDGSKPRKATTAAARMKRVIRAVRPDVVYPWLETVALLVVPLARLHGIPAVVARRNIVGARSEHLALPRLAVRRAERAARIVTANSEAVRQNAIGRGIRPERIRVVLNGHEPAAPLPLVGGTEVTLGYLAGFRPYKGHLRLLEALALLDTPTPWRVVLGGSGPLEARLREQARRLGLAERVTFAGDVTDARAFWAGCDVALLLSDHEGSPNALIEAAFAGRPLVATAVGGTPEVVADGSGFLVPPDDPRATADALRPLVEDPELRRTCGQHAHAAASERFDMERTVDGHLAALREALGAAG
jgi:glycosyltransferase involved in cell wall biosynthesis